MDDLLLLLVSILITHLEYKDSTYVLKYLGFPILTYCFQGMLYFAHLGILF